MEKIVAVLLAVTLIAFVVFMFWRENERRYADLAMTGCLGDVDTTKSALGSAQDCNGAKRLCRDVPPLVDWRRACN